jgi:hypothetical protein
VSAVLSGFAGPGLECAEDSARYSIRNLSIIRHSTFRIRHLINSMRILSGTQRFPARQFVISKEIEESLIVCAAAVKSSESN